MLGDAGGLGTATAGPGSIGLIADAGSGLATGGAADAGRVAGAVKPTGGSGRGCGNTCTGACACARPDGAAGVPCEAIVFGAEAGRAWLARSAGAALGRTTDATGAGAGAGGAAAATVAAATTTLTTGTGPAAAGFSDLRAASSSGLPGFAESCTCCAANPAWATGGAVRAMTGRSKARAGGFSLGAAAPRTLFSVGATWATTATGAFAATCCVTCMAARATGCDCTNAAVGTAMTAPGTCRLA